MEEAYEIDAVDGIDTLRNRMAAAGSPEDWSHILKDYLSAGNMKVSKSTAIFNMNSAHDCPNRETQENGASETGMCQVKWSECYAHKTERMYDQSLAFRRRQEYLWDCMTPELWAEAFSLLNDRKRKPFDSIRFSEAGDFRSNADIVRVNRIAQLVDVPVYTYSASFKLDWSLAPDFTVNASSDRMDTNRRFTAADPDTELPEGAVWCPNGMQQGDGVSAEDRIKCGECRLCVNPDGPDVVIPLH